MSCETVAFLPNVQESIMDELRTAEGMIFRDEGAKKLFVDIKCFVIEPLFTAWKTHDNETYLLILDSYVSWDKHVASKELCRLALPLNYDMIERLLPVTILYAKYLYSKTSADSAGVSIRKPKLQSFLRGMFTRFASSHHVRMGSFYDFDPLRQDFMLRDIFRQTLGNDCIEIVQVDQVKTTTTKEDCRDSDSREENLTEDEDVYPGDSISVVMAALYGDEKESKETKKQEKPNVTASAPSIIQEEQLSEVHSSVNSLPKHTSVTPRQEDAPSAAAEMNERESLVSVEKPKSVIAESVASGLSKASKITTASQFKKPSLVRRVIIEEDTNE